MKLCAKKWNCVVEILKIYNIETELWRVKISRWFCGANENSLPSIMHGLTPVIIPWNLWIRRCNACMDDKYEDDIGVWHSVKFWITKIADGFQGTIKAHQHYLLEDFKVKPTNPNSHKLRKVVWEKLSVD